MKLLKKNIMFIAIFVCLNLFLISIFEYYGKQMYIQQISNNLYTMNSIKIVDDDIDKYTKYLNEDLKVFLEVNDYIRILLKNSVDWSPKIEEGRFFTSDDKGNTAVIGEDYIDSTKEINGKRYIRMFKKDFEVIGLMKEKFVSKIDSLLFLKTDNLPSFDINNIIIDSDNKYSITKFIKSYEKENGKLQFSKVDNMGLNKSVNSDFFSELIILISILVVGFSIAVFIRYWFEITLPFLYTQYLLGVSYKKIRLLFIKNIIINMLISIIASLPFLINSEPIWSFILIIINLSISILVSILLINRWIKKNKVQRGGGLAYVERT